MGQCISPTEICSAQLDTVDPVEHVRCYLPRNHFGEHSGKATDGSGWYWYDTIGATSVDIDLTIQEWHLLHSMLDGSMMSAGIMATPEGFGPYDICVEHVNEVRAEQENVTRVHSKITQIIRAIGNNQKVTVTVIPF